MPPTTNPTAYRPLVLGMAAYCGSGQDTLAAELARAFSLQHFQLGDIFRDLALQRGERTTRAALQAIREECDRLHGPSYIPQLAAQHITNASRSAPVVATGLRRTTELQYFRTRFAFHFCFVEAPTHIRYQRLARRKTSRDPTSKRHFLVQEARERALFDLGQLHSLADSRVDFRMSLSSFHACRDAFFRSLPFYNLLSRATGILL